YAEHIVVPRSRDSNGDVGVGQQVAACVIDGDEALADVAGAVGDDGGRGLFDVAMPHKVGLGFPGNGNRLAGGEFANLRLVEVGADLQLGEVGDVDERLAGLHKVILRNWQGIDRAGERSMNVHVGVAVFRGREAGAGLGNLRTLCGKINASVALLHSLLDLRDVLLGVCQPLLG